MPWPTHQGAYNVVAVSMDIPGQPAPPSVANITQMMKGDGDPRQGERSVRKSFAAIGVHLQIKVDAATVSPTNTIDMAACSATTIMYEYSQAVAHDSTVRGADAVVLFTPSKSRCSSGGVTLGTISELESPANGWLDPRMVEHELGHGLLRLAHSGVSTTVGSNRLDTATKTGNQYGPNSVMGASPVGWSGPDQLVAGSLHMSQVITARRTGEYTIRRRELDGDTTEPALLRIPLRGHTGFYQGNPQEEVVLEYEVRTGADANPRFGKTQVIAEVWTEQNVPGSRLVAMTWEVGRLTPARPTFTIHLANDQVTVTERARDNNSVELHVEVR